MPHIVFNTLAAAVIVRNRIDNALGYPKDGVDVVGGIHAAPAATQTTHHREILKHPVNSQWAMPVRGILALLQGGETPVTLTSDWFPKGNLE